MKAKKQFNKTLELLNKIFEFNTKLKEFYNLFEEDSGYVWDLRKNKDIKYSYKKEKIKKLQLEKYKKIKDSGCFDNILFFYDENKTQIFKMKKEFIEQESKQIEEIKKWNSIEIEKWKFHDIRSICYYGIFKNYYKTLFEVLLKIIKRNNWTKEELINNKQIKISNDVVFKKYEIKQKQLFLMKMNFFRKIFNNDELLEIIIKDIVYYFFNNNDYRKKHYFLNKLEKTIFPKNFILYCFEINNEKVFFIELKNEKNFLKNKKIWKTIKIIKKYYKTIKQFNEIEFYNRFEYNKISDSFEGENKNIDVYLKERNEWKKQFNKRNCIISKLLKIWLVNKRNDEQKQVKNSFVTKERTERNKYDGILEDIVSEETISRLEYMFLDNKLKVGTKQNINSLMEKIQNQIFNFNNYFKTSKINVEQQQSNEYLVKLNTISKSVKALHENLITLDVCDLNVKNIVAEIEYMLNEVGKEIKENKLIKYDCLKVLSI